MNIATIYFFFYKLNFNIIENVYENYLYYYQI